MGDLVPYGGPSNVLALVGKRLDPEAAVAEQEKRIKEASWCTGMLAK